VGGKLCWFAIYRSKESAVQAPLMSDRIQILEREARDLRQQLELRCVLGAPLQGSFLCMCQRKPTTAIQRREAALKATNCHDHRSSRAEGAPPTSAFGRSPPFGPPFGLSPAPGPSAALSWPERDEIAEQIGKFISRCLQGQHRWPSGRDLNPLPSKLWLVARDFEGQIYSPIRVFKSWGSCRNVCKRFEDPGDSVSVRVPPEKEKQACGSRSRLLSKNE
jgi:hypothetical protein